MEIDDGILQKQKEKQRKIRLFLQKSGENRQHAKYFVYKKLAFLKVGTLFDAFSEIKTNF